MSLSQVLRAGDGAGWWSERASPGVAGAPRIGFRCAAYGVSGLGAGTPIWGLNAAPSPGVFFRHTVRVRAC
jgi:hypothetical protein